MPRRPITVEDLWALPRVGSPVPSQDGTFAVVPVTTYSMETNEGTTRLWRVPCPEGAPRALTKVETSTSQAALSPDGKLLAFVRKPGGEKAGAKAKTAPRYPDKPQLFLMPMDGGEPDRLTDLPLGVADPRWFPDGRRIAFLAPVLLEAPTLAGTEEALKSREGEVGARPFVTEDRVYRYWDRWLAGGEVHHICAIDPETRAVTDLMPGSTRWFPLMEPQGHYRIAPDGGEIAFTAMRSKPPHDPLVSGVFTVEVPAPGGTPSGTAGGAAGRAPSGAPGGLRSGPTNGPKEPMLLTADHPAHAHRPVYSPDGRFILYGIQREIDFYADRERLVAFDRRSGRHTVLTEAWDFSASGWTFGADTRTVYLVAEAEGRTALFALDFEKALGDPDRNLPREIVRGGTFTDPQIAAERIYLTRQSLDEPPEVYSYSLDGSKPTKLTYFTEAALSEVEMGRTEEIVFEGAEGHQVQMYLVHPPASSRRDAAKDSKPPLVHVIHGGPHAASADAWHWRWNAHLFAAPGYVAALVNFHGSTGWGQAFAASILGRWGDQPYKDIMAATDLLVTRGVVDPKRMAATGGSYGGYLASWIASQTDRFACIVNHAGVSDFQSQYASDVTQGRRRSMGGEPWENVEGMDRYNPARAARGFQSPMLVIHGAKDYRVPYEQGLEIYNIYKAMGLPARLVCFPEESHWILKPQNSRVWYGEFLGWLDRWLGGTSAPR